MFIRFKRGSSGPSPTGDATAADVLTGKTFSNAQAISIPGGMPERGNVIITPGAVDQVKEPGHYSGLTVKGDPDLVPQYIMKDVDIFGVIGSHVDNAPSTGDAQPGDVVQGKTFSNAQGTGLTGSLIVPAAPTGDAQPGDVLSGKTFSNAGGVGLSGTLKIVEPGGVEVYKDVSQPVAGYSTPTKAYSIKMNYSGIWRIKLNLYVSTSALPGYCQIYKNGSPYGPLHTSYAGSGGIVYTDDLSFNKDDILDAYVWRSDSGVNCNIGLYVNLLNNFVTKQ
jgi:hypothetical protein